MDGFTFFKSYLDQIEKVPKEHRLAAYEAICKYAIYGEEPDFSNGELFADLIFTGAKPTLDAGIRKSEAGKTGGRGNKKQEESAEKAEAKQTESKPKAEAKQEESTTEETEKQTENYKDKDKDKDKDIYKSRQAGSDSELKTEFEELWKLYPRKEGNKDTARKSYIKARKEGTQYTDVLFGINAYKARISSDDIAPQFIMHGSTFFRGHRWNDDFSHRARDENKFSQGMETHDYDWEKLEEDLLA